MAAVLPLSTQHTSNQQKVSHSASAVSPSSGPSQRSESRSMSSLAPATEQDHLSTSESSSDTDTEPKSSLNYTVVRDYAYGRSNILHYGPRPEDEDTPASPGGNITSWEQLQTRWGESSGGQDGTGRTSLPPLNLRDGPPYSEDEDLLSPIITTSRRRRSRQFVMGSGINSDDDIHRSGDGSDDAERSGRVDRDHTEGRRNSHFAGGRVPRRSPEEGSHEENSPDLDSDGEHIDDDESQYSRDYQFTITSPDEELHGKAVALFDFERENENELPLTEGQVIWVSYRHGQGWLVAEDPKTREIGLVPEQYVRLLREIHGGLSGLNSDMEAISPSHSPQDLVSPTSLHDVPMSKSSSQQSNGKGSYQNAPVLSTFSTSAQDLEPYPKELLGTDGQVPPPVRHLSSQTSEPHSTPTSIPEEPSQSSGFLSQPNERISDTKPAPPPPSSRRNSKAISVDGTSPKMSRKNSKTDSATSISRKDSRRGQKSSS